ncbi:hypothetical protein BC938DRAFT_475913, partial [Jimgerdemannia flammicorona]
MLFHQDTTSNDMIRLILHVLQFHDLLTGCSLPGVTTSASGMPILIPCMRALCGLREQFGEFMAELDWQSLSFCGLSPVVMILSSSCSLSPAVVILSYSCGLLSSFDIYLCNYGIFRRITNMKELDNQIYISSRTALFTVKGR